MRNTYIRILLLCIMSFSLSQAYAETFYISNLQAVYRNGQTFITWNCPEGTNLKYKVYRSKTLLDVKGKLTSAKYLGYVMDSSSLNVRKSRKQGVNVFFTIQDGDSSLTSNKGLYVVSCDKNASFYYAVTVTDLSINKEYKKVTPGVTSLLVPVAETIADPQPVLQGTEIFNTTGDLAYDYVQFGNNQNLAHYPSMFNQGSYGFNFNIVYRGNYQNGALFAFYEGLDGDALVGNGLGTFDTVTNCVIISMDDWLPVPNGYGPTGGLNTFWSGYHENYNPYILTNAIPKTGTVRMYQQHRFIHTLNWACKYLPIDSNRINLIGVSAGGFGALMTAMIVPQKIASVYTIVAPVVIKSSTANGTDTTDEQLWGDGSGNLPTDVNDPVTGLPLGIFDLMNIKTMLSINENVGLPPIYSIHGKNDITVVWSDKPTYLNQNDTYDQGGFHFWDQRSHDGGGANFFDGETTPAFNRFRRNLSYPAYATCSVNENPGNGDANDGDAYGSYSGYISWDTVTDNTCKWTCHMNMPDFTVGGVVKHSEYNYCYADVTIRRPQSFHPAINAVIDWDNYDKNNAKISSGSFTYTGGPITVKSLKIKKSGNRLEISIKNCTGREETDLTTQVTTDNISIANTNTGWMISLPSDQKQRIQISLVDVLGRTVSDKITDLHQGENAIAMDAPEHGSFIIRIDGDSRHQSQKVVY